MKTILAPLDFSEVTDKVMHATLGLAKDLQAKVVLLHVVPPPIAMTTYGIAEDSIPDVLLREQKQANERLGDYKKIFESEGVEVKTLTVQGPPVESILLVARERGVEFLVIGSHGHGAFHEFIVGSTARGVMRRFPGPVVVIPAHEAGQEERIA